MEINDAIIEKFDKDKINIGLGYIWFSGNCQMDTIAWGYDNVKNLPNYEKVW